MTTRILLWSILLIGCLETTLPNHICVMGDELTDTFATFDGGDDFRLFAFCEKAILGERGISCDSFIFGTDAWILSELLPKQGFKEVLLRTPDLSEYSIGARIVGPDPDAENFERPSVWFTFSRHTDLLLQKLTEAEIQRLPGIYLRLEGMSALVRPDFGKIFDNRNSQAKIEKLFEKYGKSAAPFYERLFAAHPLTDDDFIVYRASLRRLSADLDREILQTLTPAERKRVAQFLKKSSELDGIVVPPTMHK